jgi:chitinase
MNALSMITKAGVPSNKVVVGVASYGRSFQMTTKGCWQPHCTFTGPDSGATPGLCTQTAGYISDAEIYQIIANDPSAQQFIDGPTDTSILVYNDIQWVAYMSKDSKQSRTKKYQALNMGGTSDWAIDLEDFTTSNPVITFQPCTATFPDLPTLLNGIKALQVPSYCINIYLLNYLTTFLGNSLSTYATILTQDYDRKFDTFQKYIKSQVSTEISDYMSVNASKYFTCTKTENVVCCKDCQHIGCQGCDHRNPCTSGIQNTPYDCPKSIPNIPLFPILEDWQYTCTDTAGFYADLQNLYGISPAWIKLSGLYAGVDPSCHSVDCHKYTWTGFPVPVLDQIVVSNPKDIMVSAQANLTFLHQVLLDSSLNAQFFLYGGQTIDPVLSAIVPAYTLDYVVQNMQKIMNEADTISDAQRKAEIATWVGVALLCVPIGGEVLSALELAAAKAVLDIVGTAADVSWSIYSVVQDPKLWYTLLFTLIIDLPVAENFGKVFEKGAKVFKGIEASKVPFWGPLASDEIQSIVAGRPATCAALNS